MCHCTSLSPVIILDNNVWYGGMVIGDEGGGVHKNTSEGSTENHKS